MIKQKTIFTDIDGTLVHQVQFENLDPNLSKALPGVVDKMVGWFNEGHHIVLTIWASASVSVSRRSAWWCLPCRRRCSSLSGAPSGSSSWSRHRSRQKTSLGDSAPKTLRIPQHMSTQE